MNKCCLMLTLVCLFVFAACDDATVAGDTYVLNVIDEVDFLEFDGGHVTSDVTYRDPGWSFSIDGTSYRGRVTETFNADGTFSFVEELYESANLDIDGNGVQGEGYINYNIETGTYGYESSTWVLSTNVTSIVEYHQYDSDLEYTVYSSTPFYYTSNYTETEKAFFTEKNHDRVYEKSGADWVNTHTWTNNYSGGSSYTYTSTYSFGHDEIEYHYTNENTTDTAYITYEREAIYAVSDESPADTELGEGVIKNYRGYYTTEHRRYYDSDTGSMGAWEEDPYSNVADGDYNTFDVACLGDVLIFMYDLTDVQRSLER